jgi:hypothetical protein
MDSSSGVTSPFQDVMMSVQTALGSAHEFAFGVVDRCEQVRVSVVRSAYEHLPESYAYLVDRITKAVPETFAAIGAIFGGILVVPALLISWGRKIEPAMPSIMNVLRGEFSSEQLIGGLQRTLQNFKDMFDRCLVPAFFVAISVDTIASFVFGYLTMDLGRMLHASTIALPGALLAAAYMLNQKGESSPFVAASSSTKGSH